MPAKWQRIKIPIKGLGLNSSQREEVADLIVERIVERTDKGKDKEGKSFPKYSKEYKESLDFKVAGKGSNVNLQLSGDMLAALEPLDVSSRSITVGFKNGSEENAKADGNIRGTYGKPKADPSKARDFLGITDSELMKIVRYVKGQ